MEVGAYAPTANPRGPAKAGRVADGPGVAEKPGNSRGANGPWCEKSAGRRKGPWRVARALGPLCSALGLSGALHAEAKGDAARWVVLPGRGRGAGTGRTARPVSAGIGQSSAPRISRIVLN